MFRDASRIGWAMLFTCQFGVFGKVCASISLSLLNLLSSLCMASCLWVLKIGFDIFPVSLLVFYVLFRAYLVVVCFINLAHLPDSAFLVPEWSCYVPHIG